MIRTLVLDSGALIAFEKGDIELGALLRHAFLKDAVVLVPAGVVAEVWRNAGRQGKIARVIGAADGVPWIDFECARRVGLLLASKGHASIVDGQVVDVALRHQPAAIASSDPDVWRLLRFAGPSNVKLVRV